MRVSDVMTPCPYRTTTDATVNEALEKMLLRNVRHLPVIEDGRLIGVFSERDARVSLAISINTNITECVGTVCARDPYICQADDDVSLVAREMAERRIDCALVADEQGNFVGIFTTTDACRLIHLILEEISGEE